MKEYVIGKISSNERLPLTTVLDTLLQQSLDRVNKPPTLGAKLLLVGSIAATGSSVESLYHETTLSRAVSWMAAAAQQQKDCISTVVKNCNVIFAYLAGSKDMIGGKLLQNALACGDGLRDNEGPLLKSARELIATTPTLDAPVATVELFLWCRDLVGWKEYYYCWLYSTIWRAESKALHDIEQQFNINLLTNPPQGVSPYNTRLGLLEAGVIPTTSATSLMHEQEIEKQTWKAYEIDTEKIHKATWEAQLHKVQQARTKLTQFALNTLKFEDGWMKDPLMLQKQLPAEEGEQRNANSTKLRTDCLPQVIFVALELAERHNDMPLLKDIIVTLAQEKNGLQECVTGEYKSHLEQILQQTSKLLVNNTPPQ
eukprot:TRINITY_DN67059_c5_g3_i1.p1 TRINITY_DN67059_c5_g3~~TRINITY_DN67059_c5_g3_i1.p1  ORF type:complete len:392 (-),score=57.00 TRINITY_DN67059_c5_g3_i1:1203-2312(-)